MTGVAAFILLANISDQRLRTLRLYFEGCDQRVFRLNDNVSRFSLNFKANRILHVRVPAWVKVSTIQLGGVRLLSHKQHSYRTNVISRPKSMIGGGCVYRSSGICYAATCPPFRGGLLEAERRQVTVLFTDMIGFTTFSERSGEEAAFTLTQSLSKLMGEAVRDPRFELLAPDGSQ